jgi:putative alpha-1,2-mannosidase
MSLGYVAADLHSESGSRTLDYSCKFRSRLIHDSIRYTVYQEKREELTMTLDDDWAASLVARQLGETEIADNLLARSSSWKNLFNNATGFMEARNSDGSWAGEEVGWTEGDHWAYSLDVMVRPLFFLSISLSLLLSSCSSRLLRRFLRPSLHFMSQSCL